MRQRQFAMFAIALILLALVARHPSARIEVLSHDASDPSPHRVQAAVDIGVVAFSVLVTWTGKHLTSPN